MNVRIAIIDTNTLAIIGLKQVLESVMPIMEIDTFSSFDELIGADPDSYFHYFTDISIVLQHMDFFRERVHKTIVLTKSYTANSQIAFFHSLCVNQSEQKFIKDLLMLVQSAHAHGRHLPRVDKSDDTRMLSPREAEVLTHMAYGLTNKEIADKLCISITTVISHRKNIMDKLGMRTLSALTIYAVMNGYVDVNRI